MFQLIIKNINGQVVEEINYKLNDGNPNVNDVKNNLNSLLLNKVLVSYDKQKNKFFYKRVLPVTNTNYTMYLNIINSEDFLGFYKSDRNNLILLPYLQNIYCSYVVNTVGDEAIIIKLTGDCILEGNTIDNFGSNTYEPSKIIFMKPIDVPANGLLKYNNEDGGDSFQYKLANVEQITYFNLTVYNQDDELIPDFSDYLLLLQFVKHKLEENKIESLLNMIIDYLKQIYLLISHVLFPPTL
jgi:predicted transcriptional regulator